MDALNSAVKKPTLINRADSPETKPAQGNPLLVEISLKSEKEWLTIIEQFEDANFYQTKTFGKHSTGGKKLEHFILKENGKIIAAAEVRISIIGFLKRGIAYIRWGPLWKLKNEEHQISKLETVLKELRNEYVIKRRLKLRIFPECYENDNDFLIDVYKKAGFKLNKKYRNEKTIILNIKPHLKEIRSNFKSKWRNRLKKSEQNDFDIISGHSDILFEKFFKIYEEMHEFKHFKDQIGVGSFEVMQHDLPEKYKMKVFLAESGGSPAAALVGTAIGNTGICLLAASNKLGRQLSASYQLHIRMIEWLKNMNCNYYDLGGIDPVKNPGGYRFKSGFNGKEVTFIGAFEACICPVSWIITKAGEIYFKLLHYIKF